MNKIIYINCVGIDGKLHMCDPTKNVCKCGIKVLKKKLDKNDYARFSCYECTY